VEEIRNMHTDLWWGSLNVRGTLGNPRNMWENTVKMNLQGIGWEGVERVFLSEERHKQWPCERGY
jgi:hypothetical protein